MEITIEVLRELLPDFQQQRDEALRKLGAIEGAIQFCNHLIAKLQEDIDLVAADEPAEKDEHGES